MTEMFCSYLHGLKDISATSHNTTTKHVLAITHEEKT